ncbi:MAG: HU family DNA-binding protein [Candidatus Auribacterota bacterium]|jgi:nucleoid DNA-binding protein|nr:HU family DNA-binding protein [Candidatus Auribacterota bacterium]
MTKRDLVVRIANETGLTQQNVYAIIQKSFDLIIDALQNGDAVELRNFGVFKVTKRHARTGINPNQPTQKIDIPAKKVVVFKQGKHMKEVVRK